MWGTCAHGSRGKRPRVPWQAPTVCHGVPWQAQTGHVTSAHGSRGKHPRVPWQAPTGPVASAHGMPRGANAHGMPRFPWQAPTVCHGMPREDKSTVGPWARGPVGIISFPWHTVGAPVAYRGRYANGVFKSKFTVGMPTDSIQLSPLLFRMPDVHFFQRKVFTENHFDVS